MKILFRITLFLITLFAGTGAYAGTIVFNEKNAVVWLPQQSIAGSVIGDNNHDLQVHCNNKAYPATINMDNTFKCMVKLTNGKNKIWATCRQGSNTIVSVPLMLTMGYHLLPEVKPLAIIKNGKAKLDVQLIDNPSAQVLKYEWSAAKGNPANAAIANKNLATSTVTIPVENGAYYFDLLVTSGSDSARFRTYIRRNGKTLHAYNSTADHSAWIDKAVIYEINPSVFVKHGTYDAITAKLGEIKSLGINTIWLQPVYKTDDHGQGYSVIDYFKLRDDYGNEQQLTNLISTAKKMNLRVIFDFVPNHTSVNHPYALDCIKYGDSSHYYHFYQRDNDGKAYSSFYRKDTNGFYFYFWDKLVNLDYNNPEVQHWILEAAAYWIKKYDIDGYRFDAMWGLNARSPRFIEMLNTRLKSIKPDLLLLAEDKASDKLVYTSGFDATYDWTADSNWVSQWAWQTHHSDLKSLTIFNSPDTLKRAGLLTKAIFNNASVSNTTLRFIENNDVPRFIATHNLAQTKMAAALIFAVPGIPMLYNGQEAGCKAYPYAVKTIYTADKTIAQSDSLALFPYYQKLIQLHAQYPALHSRRIGKIQLMNNPYMVAFQRWEGDQHFIVVLNLRSTSSAANIDLANTNLNTTGRSCLKDVLTNNVFTTNTRYNTCANVPMEGYSIRWLLIKKL